MDFLLKSLEQREDFELIQAYMAVFLNVSIQHSLQGYFLKYRQQSHDSVESLILLTCLGTRSRSFQTD